MHLYSLTLQRSTAIVTACVGNFTGTKQQEIAVSRGKVLELLCPDENGKVQSLASYECFGLVRSIVAFRLTGTPRFTNCSLCIIPTHSSPHGLSNRSRMFTGMMRQALPRITWFSARIRGASRSLSLTPRQTASIGSTWRPLARAAADESFLGSFSPLIRAAVP
jgi:hypothetical protein